MCRAKSAHELRDDFLGALRMDVDYWASDAITTHNSLRERLSGLAFSILCAIDGVAGNFPMSLDLVARTHPDDKQFHIDEGEDWIEDGTVLNADCHLHDLWH